MTKQRIEEWLDDIFSGYKWYRRRRGGVWYQVRVALLQGLPYGWVRQPKDFEAGLDIDFETIVNKEIYG
jgi:hypothetical protein